MGLVASRDIRSFFFCLIGVGVVWPPMPAAAQTRSEAEADRKEVQVFSRKELGFDQPRIKALAAVWTTLEFSPQIKLQGTEVEQRGGGILITEAEFDTTVIGQGQVRLDRNDTNRQRRGDASADAAPLPNPLVRRDSLYEWELGVRKKLREGVILQPSVRYRRSGTSDQGEFENRGEFGFQFGVVIPLAKGLGRLSNEAPEIAATFDYEASLYALRHVTARSVFDTMAIYWQCRAAEERYDLIRQTEEISARLVGLTEALVRAGELGSSQLAQILADENSTIAQRIRSEQELIFARQRLALAMGWNPALIAQAPLVQDSFPEPREPMAFPDRVELTFAALSLRDDLRASKLLEKSRKVLVEAAWLNLRPTVDLRLDAGFVPFQGRTDRTSQTGGEWIGSVGLSLDWPVENSFASGRLIQDSAVYLRSQIDVEDLTRNISSGIISTLARLRGSAGEALRQRQAASQNGEALAAQEELFSHGQANLTDVITARQRLIQSQLQYIDALETYAVSIIQIRFESGTLLPWDDTGNWVSPDLWRTLPFVGK